MLFYHRAMRPKDADRMANSVDPDQTGSVDPDQTAHSLIWVYTVCPDLPVRKLRTITGKTAINYHKTVSWNST